MSVVVVPMMIPAHLVSDGPGPCEVVLKVNTTEGDEEIIVDRSFFSQGHVDLPIVGQDWPNALVELPQESVRGKWRLRIPLR